MLNSIKEDNIESSLASIDGEDKSSRNDILIDWKYKASYGKLPLNDKKQKKEKIKNYNISSSINKNSVKNSLNASQSIYHMANKNKKKKEVYKSTNNFFENKNKREIQVGLKSIKIDDDISKKKEVELNEYQKIERGERSSKSIKKKKNKSITNHIYKVTDDDFRGDSPSNKQDNLHIDIIDTSHNNDNEESYYGEKILININDLNFLFSKFKETNNLKDYKKEELSDENTYENLKRISCIINNSPFMSSNIYLKNKINTTSIEYLLGKDKCRFFEKNKNIYKGKSAKELFKKISEDIYQEVDSLLSEKLYDIDPTKVSIGQLYKNNENYNNEYLKSKYIRDITNLDGNAFLRAFIFNYLEQLISRKNIKILTEIMGKIILYFKTIKEKKETISRVLSVFKIIINYIEQDNISNANKILIKSFSDDYNFEQNIIGFVKESISESIICHQSYFIMEHLKEIVKDKYIKKNDKDQIYFDYELFINEIIKNSNNELQYELLIYYFLAPIYEIDLIIYTNNDSKTNKITFKHTNIEYEENETITIELYISFGRVSIIYSDQYYKEYQDMISLISTSEIPIDKIKIKANDRKSNCYMCKEIPDEFILIDKNYQLICKKCLTKIIQKIIDKRYLLFSDTDNHYFHEEFYCNKIDYNINSDKINSYDLNISINDIKHILPNYSDISNEIYTKIIKSFKCGRCKESFKKMKNAFSMNPCGHLICLKCLKDYICKATDEKVILNYFEYKLKQIKFFCPACDKEIILSKNLINNLYNDDKYINGAEERLIDAAKNMCSFCHTNDKSKIKKTFVIVNEFASSSSSIDNYLLVHSVCVDCENNLKANELNNNIKTFFCDFCEENHQYNKIKFNIQGKRKACCAPM